MLNGRIVKPQRVIDGARTLNRQQSSQSGLMRCKPSAYPGRKRIRRRSSSRLPGMNILGHLSGGNCFNRHDRTTLQSLGCHIWVS